MFLHFLFSKAKVITNLSLSSEDRAHRIGQRDSVLVQYLLAGGTSDDHVWDMLGRKLNVLGQVGLASASDESFRGADKEYQRVVRPLPILISIPFVLSSVLRHLLFIIIIVFLFLLLFSFVNCLWSFFCLF